MAWLDNKIEVIIRQTTPAPYHNLVEVVDAATGEVLFSKREDDVKAAFAAGERYATAELTIERDVGENGNELRSVRVADEIICGGWRKPFRKRGGKKSYVKVYPLRMVELPDRLVLAVIKLAPFLRTDGYINQPKGKRKIKRAEDLFEIWGLASSSGYELLSLLKDAAIIDKDDDGWRLAKELMGRG